MNILNLKTTTKFLVISSILACSTMTYAAPTIKQQAEADRAESQKNAIAKICAGAINTAADVQIAFENCDESTLNKMYVSLADIEQDTNDLQDQVTALESKNRPELDQLESLKTKRTLATVVFWGSTGTAFALGLTGNLPKMARGIPVALLLSALVFEYYQSNQKSADLIEFKIKYKDLAELRTKLAEFQTKVGHQRELVDWMLKLKGQQPN